MPSEPDVAARQRSWDEAAARLAAAKARSKQFTNLYEATRSVFLDGDAHSSTAGVVAMPKPRGRPNILDKGLATPGQWGAYRSPLPSRLGSKQADLCGGDNLQLKAVKSWLKAMAKQHCEEEVVFTMLYELHCKGAAFDWSNSVKIKHRRQTITWPSALEHHI